MIRGHGLAGTIGALAILAGAAGPAAEPAVPMLNLKDDGYRGIWYMNQPWGDEYVYKYSGGLGTYCARHQPFVVYCSPVN